MPFSDRVPITFRFARVAGLLVFAQVFALLEGGVYTQRHSAETLWRSEMFHLLSEKRAQIDRDLNGLFNLTSALSSYLAVKRGHADDGEINAMLAGLFYKSRYVLNFGIAVGYQLRYIYPSSGNEKAMGLDYRQHAEQWPTVERTIRTNSGVLTGPLDWVQGGRGLVYRVPVVIDGHYWGLLSTAIEVDAILKSALADMPPTYALAIRSVAVDGEQGDLLSGERALFSDPTAVKLIAALPGGHWEYAIRQVRGAGYDNYWLRLHLLAFVFSLLPGYFAYISQRQRFLLYNVAREDPLTRLLNRRAMEAALEAMLARRRKTDQGCAVLFVDLDRFKEINDTYGHKAGDAVLAAVAKRLSEQMRAADLVGRWGGDELVLLVEHHSEHEVQQVIQRLYAAINREIEFEGQQLRVGASIGGAIFPRDGRSLQTLLRVADENMYREKQRQKSSGKK